MTKMGFEDGALFELRFWLPVLGDHARFIKDGLAPGEVAEIYSAQQFIQAFDKFSDSVKVKRSSLRVICVLDCRISLLCGGLIKKLIPLCSSS